MSTAQFSTAIQPLTPQGPFRNERATDFGDHANQRAFREELERVNEMLGREYELIVGGERLTTTEKIRSVNPARPAQLVGLHQKAQAADAPKAMSAALKAFESWRHAEPAQRASLLLQAAAILRHRKLEFCGWLVYEVGKNWGEADADVGESIDFLELYAREALRLAAVEPPIQYLGERNELRYIPLGVGAIISPWNFPLAIATGMTAAAIATGNTVILKPSSESPTIAAHFVSALEEAGMPPGVVNFCPGAGESFGNAIVEHPQTRFIAFTGSRSVGLKIFARAAVTAPGQIWLKRCILEMGGKNAIIVCSDCDIDRAVEGVVAAAFGFSGQKCSACSRVVVEESIYDAFLELLESRVAELKVGDPAANCDLGPVVSGGALETILSYIEIGKSEGRLIAGGSRLARAGSGYYLTPTVFADVEPKARIAQEEIFGPVLAVIRARDFEEALQIANGTEYGLTGGVYSGDRQKLEHARREFHAGNLYLNRKCTGAMVGAHPFGGFNMSGTGSKAGGPDYLLSFTQAQSIAEKL